MSLPPRRRIASSLIIAALVLIWHQVDAVTNPMRSVLQCDPMPEVRPNQQPPMVCQNYCSARYVKRDADHRAANEDLAKFFIDTKTPPQIKCCCIFNTPWPEFVDTKSVGREHDFRSTLKQVGDCLPLFMAVNLSARTKDSYHRVCRYLSKRHKLTMLETMDFAEAAHHLNFMHPKHPAILKTLHLKDMKKLTKEAFVEISEAFIPHLLDTVKAFEDYEGYNFKAKRLREFVDIRKSLPAAMKSRIVAEAFDELVTSHVLVDLVAASKRVDEINSKLELPEEVILGSYDKYDPNQLPVYFTMERVDCKYVDSEAARLQTYLSNVKSVLGILFEKLVYENMQEKFEPLRHILQCQKSYNHILDINCRKRGRSVSHG